MKKTKLTKQISPRQRLPPLGNKTHKVAKIVRGINELPDDILSLILAFVIQNRKSSISKLRLVCKHWNALFEHSQLPWQAFSVSHFPKAISLSTSTSSKTPFDWKNTTMKNVIQERRKKLQPEIRRSLQPNARANDLEHAIKSLSIDWKRVIRLNGNVLFGCTNVANDIHIHGKLITLYTTSSQGTTLNICDLHSVSVVSRSRSLESGMEFPILKIENTKQMQPIANDQVINLYQLQDTQTSGLVILGGYKTGEIAFVSATLHCQSFVTSIWNKETPKRVKHTPVFDDIDSHYGLQNYTVDIVFRNFDSVIWEQTFHNIDATINEHSSVQLDIIQRSGKVSEIVPSKPQLAWRTEAFHSIIDGIFIVDACVYDLHDEPIWEFSCVASFTKPSPASTSTSSAGGFFDEPGETILTWNFVDQSEKSSIGASLIEYTNGQGECALVELWIAFDRQFLSQWFGKKIANIL